jgi:predicted lipid-binding transport protein (Tim44 family)
MRHLTAIRFLPLLAVAAGCESMSHTDKGVLGGGAIGAGTGALIGSATGHTGAGAAIGAGIGAVTGGLIGNDIDQSEAKTKAEIAQASAAAAAAPAHGPLSLPDIAQMAQSGLSDAVIIGQIRATRSVYVLTPQDLAWLKTQQVSDAVVMEMQATASRVPPPGRVYARPYYSPDVVYVDPYGPPVGVGVTYRYRRW